MELRCQPTEGGFSITLQAPVGTRWWLEYYLTGSGGYQESGELSGTMAAPTETVRRAVRVAVIEVGVISLSLDGPSRPRNRPARLEGHAPVIRPVPLADVETP
jgi:hypothetical protein